MFSARLIQVVCSKTVSSHVDLRGHTSSTESARVLFKCSKDPASLVVCNEKNFFWYWVSEFL